MNWDENGECWTADHYSDWQEVAGWEVVGVEEWKPGVKRISIRSNVNTLPVSFRMVYASELSLPGLALLRFIPQPKPANELKRRE